MALIKSKQIEKLLDGVLRANAFAGTGLSNNVTAAITAVLATASGSGGSVPLQIATSTAMGVVVAATKNKVAIYVAATKLPLSDGNGNEVYGRVTEAAGTYTLGYFSLVAGTETAFTLPATSIDFEFFYRFDFASLPADFATGVQARNVTDDVGQGALHVEELRNPTALNTIGALSFTPNPLASLVLVVNGKEESNLDGSFSVIGTAVTWIPATAGYPLETTDKVITRYRR
jgi:hypothetical protein